jgi:hypothetical protein
MVSEKKKTDLKLNIDSDSSNTSIINSLFVRRTTKLGNLLKFGSSASLTTSKNSNDQTVTQNQFDPCVNRSIVFKGSATSLNTIGSLPPSPPPPTLCSQTSYTQSIDSYSITALDSISNQGDNDTHHQHVKIYKSVSVRSSLKNLCDNMRLQILSRAFYGWLAYHRHLKTVRIHMTSLIIKNCDDESVDGAKELKETSNECLNLVNIMETYYVEKRRLDEDLWNEMMKNFRKLNKNDKKYFHKIVYNNGIEPSMRKIVSFKHILIF